MCVVVGSRLVCVLALLSRDSDPAILIVLHRHSLVVDEAGMLLRVLVRYIEGVSRELDSASSLGFDQVGILVS